jgi:hypothetical protein
VISIRHRYSVPFFSLLEFFFSLASAKDQMVKKNVTKSGVIHLRVGNHFFAILIIMINLLEKSLIFYFESVACESQYSVRFTWQVYKECSKKCFEP